MRRPACFEMDDSRFTNSAMEFLGTTTSHSSMDVVLPLIASRNAPRADQMLSLRSSVSAKSTSRAPNASAVSVSLSTGCSSAFSLIPSSLTSRYASALVSGNCLPRYSSAQEMTSRSMNSTAVGSQPQLSISGTACMHLSRSSNGISSDMLTLGSGISLTVSPVRKPSVPSLPAISSIRLYPDDVFTVLPPRCSSVPSASATSIPSM